jgi:hypothetical protein
MTALVTPQTDRATALSEAIVRIAEFWTLSNTSWVRSSASPRRRSPA